MLKYAEKALERRCFVAVAIIAALNGCANTPYVDARREAGQREPVGASSPDLVAICYSRYAVTRADVIKLADSECGKTGRVAKFDHEDAWACTFIAPARAFYRCVAKP